MKILLTIALGLSPEEIGFGQPMPSLPKGSKWLQNFRELRESYKSTGLEVKRAVISKAQGVMANSSMASTGRIMENRLRAFAPA